MGADVFAVCAVILVKSLCRKDLLYTTAVAMLSFEALLSNQQYIDCHDSLYVSQA